MVKKTKDQSWKDRFLSPQEIAQMEAVFNDKFFDELDKDENISFEGYFSDQSLFITLILSNSDQTYYYPVETVLSIKDNFGIDADEARLILLDFIGSYFDEFFTSGRDTFLPIDWCEYKMDKTRFFVRGQVINKKLEDMAEDILKGGRNSDGRTNKGNKTKGR